MSHDEKKPVFSVTSGTKNQCDVTSVLYDISSNTESKWYNSVN